MEQRSQELQLDAEGAQRAYQTFEPATERR